MTRDEEAKLIHLAKVVEQALPAAALAPRLALANLLCLVTSSGAALEIVTAALTAKTRELEELRAARPQLMFVRGGKS